MDIDTRLEAFKQTFWIARLLAAGFTPADTPQPAAVPSPSRAIAPDTTLITHPWVGDLDGMVKRHMIRVLTPYTKTHYFIDKGVERGVTYDALKLFDDELNRKLKTGALPVHLVFVPTSRDKLKDALLEGRGDIIAANVTRTESEIAVADFVTPTSTTSRNWLSPVRARRRSRVWTIWRVTPIRRPGGRAGQTIRIDGLPASVTDVLARVERDDGTAQIARLLPAQPAFVVDPPAKASGVAWAYLVLGLEHILSGIDHLLYILALLFLVKGWRRIMATMSAFTATHSLTLSAAALGWVHVPQPPVEACIALSIVFVAREIVETRHGRPGLTGRWPWVVSFTFGLMHGFGFAGALAEVGLPTRAISVALLFFNVGVEIGQLLFVAGVLAVLAALARAPRRWPAWAEGVPAYAIGSVAMF